MVNNTFYTRVVATSVMNDQPVDPQISEFERVSKAVIPLLAHGRDGGCADFRVSLDHLQEPAYTFNPAFLILGVRYFAIPNNVVDDLDIRKGQRFYAWY